MTFSSMTLVSCPLSLLIKTAAAPLTIHGGYLYQKQTAAMTVRKEYCIDIAVADSDLFKLVGELNQILIFLGFEGFS